MGLTPWAPAGHLIEQLNLNLDQYTMTFPYDPPIHPPSESAKHDVPTDAALFNPQLRSSLSQSTANDFHSQPQP